MISDIIASFVVGIADLPSIEKNVGGKTRIVSHNCIRFFFLDLI